jgi:nitrate reductase gamma subunit
MSGPQWFLLACFIVFAVGTRYRINKAFPRPGTDSLAAKRGDIPPAVLYSLTGAMMPWKKETAALHPVSYALGIGYHAGIFLSFIWLVLMFSGLGLPAQAAAASAVVLALASLCGLALLVKRLITPAMRYFSNPDDYFSNLIATGFVALTAAALVREAMTPALFIYAGILLLYIPVGKLRHALYFALARVYLGLFYGRRGVWPRGDRKTWQT